MTIDPTVSKVYDAKILIASADHINIRFSSFYNKLLIQKQRNPLIADELISYADSLKEQLLVLSNCLTTKQPIEYQGQWHKALSIIGSMESILNSSE